MEFTRRELGAAAFGLMATWRIPNWMAAPMGPLKIGLLTDCHYADADTRGTRFYRESLGKVDEAARLFRARGVDLLFELGDLIDAADSRSRGAELAFLRQVDYRLRACGAPRRYVLGNHCVTSLSKEDFLKTVGQRSSYFSEDVSGVHLVVLDACFRKDGTAYKEGNFEWTDTDVPLEQREWLRQDLERTELPTLVFCHQRLDLDKPSPYAVSSAQAVRRVLAESGKVIGVFMGHSHTNELKVVDDVPYATLAAVVEGSGKTNNAYSVLTVGPNSLSLEGYRQHEQHPLGSKSVALSLAP